MAARSLLLQLYDVLRHFDTVGPVGSSRLRNIGQPRIVRDAVNQLLRYRSELPDVYGIVMAPCISMQAAEICIKDRLECTTLVVDYFRHLLPDLNHSSVFAAFLEIIRYCQSDRFKSRNEPFGHIFRAVVPYILQIPVTGSPHVLD